MIVRLGGWSVTLLKERPYTRVMRWKFTVRFPRVELDLGSVRFTTKETSDLREWAAVVDAAKQPRPEGPSELAQGCVRVAVRRSGVGPYVSVTADVTAAKRKYGDGVTACGASFLVEDLRALLASRGK